MANQNNDPCTALVSWQLPLALDGGYGEWYIIWIPHEKLDTLSYKKSHSMSKVTRDCQNESVFPE